MSDLSASRPHRRWRLAGWTGWAAAAAVYGGGQAVSSWLAFLTRGDGPRPQYAAFAQPRFAPPGAVFPVVWSALNLTTATSAWRLLRGAANAGGTANAGGVTGCGAAAPHHVAGAGGADDARRAALAWWAVAVVIRTGYVPLAFGGRRLWAATADSALLCAAMVRYAALARRADGPAAALAAPEIAWTAFATVLSTAVARRNP